MQNEGSALGHETKSKIQSWQFKKEKGQVDHFKNGEGSAHTHNEDKALVPLLIRKYEPPGYVGQQNEKQPHSKRVEQIDKKFSNHKNAHLYI